MSPASPGTKGHEQPKRQVLALWKAVSNASTPGTSPSPTGLYRSSTNCRPTRHPKGARMRASTTTLDATWISVRRHLLLLANGATTSFEQKVSSGKNEGTGPTFGHHELAEFEGRWAKVSSDGGKRAILWDAIEVAFHHAPPTRRKASLPYVPDTLRDRWRIEALGQEMMKLRGTEQWKLAVGKEEGSVREVAAIYGEARSTVQDWRMVPTANSTSTVPPRPWTESAARCGSSTATDELDAMGVRFLDNPQERS
jgi:hypothetical protein